VDDRQRAFYAPLLHSHASICTEPYSRLVTPYEASYNPPVPGIRPVLRTTLRRRSKQPSYTALREFSIIRRFIGQPRCTIQARRTAGTTTSASKASRHFSTHSLDIYTTCTIIRTITHQLPYHPSPLRITAAPCSASATKLV
jgi:hypothetical protein